MFRKTNIPYPQISTRTCAYQGVRNVRFSDNLACFVFLNHLFWDSLFCLITDEFYENHYNSEIDICPDCKWRSSYLRDLVPCNFFIKIICLYSIYWFFLEVILFQNLVIYFNCIYTLRAYHVWSRNFQSSRKLCLRLGRLTFRKVSKLLLY